MQELVAQEALVAISAFSLRLRMRDTVPEEPALPEEPSEETKQNDAVAKELFDDVRQWLQA